MAALWWHSEIRVLSEALTSLGELKDVIKVRLGEMGFKDVRVNDLEVAGGKNNVWVSIAHFHISGRKYWEVVMGSGDSGDTTRKTVDKVVKMLEGLLFL